MFLIIPTGVDYQTRRYPVVTFTLMGLNVAIYLLTLAFWFMDFDRPEADSLELWWIINFWLIPMKSLWYTYFTCMFVHADFWHLLGNMIYLFLFGACVEDTIGRGKFIALYLIGGLLSSFAHIAVQAGHFESLLPLGGASGAISAAMGAFLILLPKRQIEFKYIFFMFFRFGSGDFTMASWIVMSFWFLKDLLFAILSQGHEGGGTAFGAHAGGFIAGMGLGMLCKLILKKQEWMSAMAARAPEMPAYRSSEPATIYIYEAGNQLGPFTQSQVLQMRTLGSVGAEAVYWQEGMADWQRVHDL